MLKKQIPNLITLCNLLCGVIAVYFTLSASNTQGIRVGALMICMGILFDFFDGLAARLLHVPSAMGKELDSLADVVTSGVAPAMILLRILETYNHVLAFFAFLMPLFAAYRLAKFNLDTRQSHSFLGLPVPSNALIWVGIALSGWMPEATADASLWIAVSFAVISLIGDVLMVSELPLFSLKFDFKNLSWEKNKIQYIFLLGCIAIIGLLRSWISLSAIILWYIILSIATQRRHRNA